MKKESIHFYFVVGIILIIMGIFSLVYGFIIPTTFFTINEFPSLIFKISGIVFIVFGLGLMITMRKKKEIKIGDKKNILIGGDAND